MRKNTIIKTAIAVIIWLLIWEVAALCLGSDILLVSFDRVIIRLGELIVTADFWNRVGVSFGHIICGFLLGLVLGCMLSYLAFRLTFIKIFLSPFVAILRAVPVASFIILMLVWVSSKVLAVPICFIIVFPVVYANMFAGFSALDTALFEMSEVFNMTQKNRIRYVIVPQMMPYIKAAVIVSVGLAWKSGIAAEVIGMSAGSIGEILQQSKVYLMMRDLFAWTVVIVLLSVLMGKILTLIINRLEVKLAKEPNG